ncbi:DUF4326 domain-containing protein [Comamonas sp. BIGb0124]|uniref:DUF4326 domain-containing protein n=1 Tax=Comamonas sp. BIGb0124 TaxID=2485130 RepID=UPI0018F4BEE4|nr:DUF4326 domain-containing protein [Comamonas sp. BIGb0124]
MEEIRLLIAVSASIREVQVFKEVAKISAFDGVVGYVDNHLVLREVVTSKWPNAEAVKVKSRVSARKAMGQYTHLILIWDGEDLSQLLFEARLQRRKTKVIPVSVTRVVNKKLTNDFDVYIGRGSPWGNPYAISQGDGPDREEVIERYRGFFTEKIRTDEGFRSAVMGLKGLKLACFCKPQACHGDVIAEYLDSLPCEAEGDEGN